MAQKQTQVPAVAPQQEVHPLCKINIPKQLAPFAQAFAEPLATFRQCFPSNKEADMAYLKQVEFAMQAMQANSYLVSCAQKSPIPLINALKQVALSGLSLSPVVKQGYLVPFKGEISFMPSYIGLRDLLVRTGLVQNIEAHIVYVDDFFEITYGNGSHLLHKPAVFSKNRTAKDILGGYFIATLSSGKLVYDTMSADELEEIHKRSPSFGKQSPWDTDRTEMLKKTLIRRGFKSVPHTNASAEQLKVIEMAFDNDGQFFYDPTINEQKAPSRASFFDETSVIDEQPAQTSQPATDEQHNAQQ